METNVNFYLLATDKPSNIHFNEDNYYFLTKEKCLVGKNLNLYVTLPKSDLVISNILNGDWCLDNYQINEEGESEINVYQKKKGLEYCDSSTEEKIIAATDKSLVIHEIEHYGLGASADKYTKLYSIPQKFIEYFIKELNMEHLINFGKVELDPEIVYDPVSGYYAPINLNNSTIEINLKNEISIVMPDFKNLNTISSENYGDDGVGLTSEELNNIIIPEKERGINIVNVDEKKYTRKEVEILCNKAINFGYYLNFPEKTLEDFFPKYEKKQNWIKENL